MDYLLVICHWRGRNWGQNWGFYCYNGILNSWANDESSLCHCTTTTVIITNWILSSSSFPILSSLPPSRCVRVSEQREEAHHLRRRHRQEPHQSAQGPGRQRAQERHTGLSLGSLRSLWEPEGTQEPQWAWGSWGFWGAQGVLRNLKGLWSLRILWNLSSLRSLRSLRSLLPFLFVVCTVKLVGNFVLFK